MMKKLLFFSFYLFISAFLIAQSSGLETSIKVDKKIYANLNENHFIVLSDGDSFLIIIGVASEDSVYFYKDKYLNEIKKLVNKINEKTTTDSF